MGEVPRLLVPADLMFESSDHRKQGFYLAPM